MQHDVDDLWEPLEGALIEHGSRCALAALHLTDVRRRQTCLRALRARRGTRPVFKRVVVVDDDDDNDGAEPRVTTGPVPRPDFPLAAPRELALRTPHLRLPAGVWAAALDMGGGQVPDRLALTSTVDSPDMSGVAHLLDALPGLTALELAWGESGEFQDHEDVRADEEGAFDAMGDAVVGHLPASLTSLVCLGLGKPMRRVLWAPGCCPNLVELALVVDGTLWLDDDAPVRADKLPHVRRLRLCGNEVTGLADVLGLFPGLEELGISMYEGDAGSGQQALLEPVLQYAEATPSLASLTLLFSGDAPPSWATEPWAHRYAPVFRRLTHVCVGAGEATDAFVQHYAPLPSLRRLTVSSVVDGDSVAARHVLSILAGAPDVRTLELGLVGADSTDEIVALAQQAGRLRVMCSVSSFPSRCRGILLEGAVLYLWTHDAVRAKPRAAQQAALAALAGSPSISGVVLGPHLMSEYDAQLALAALAGPAHGRRKTVVLRLPWAATRGVPRFQRAVDLLCARLSAGGELPPLRVRVLLTAGAQWRDVGAWVARVQRAAAAGGRDVAVEVEVDRYYAPESVAAMRAAIDAQPGGRGGSHSVEIVRAGAYFEQPFQSTPPFDLL